MFVCLWGNEDILLIIFEKIIFFQIYNQFVLLNVTSFILLKSLNRFN